MSIKEALGKQRLEKVRARRNAQVIVCDCGSTVVKSNMERHMTTDKHTGGHGAVSSLEPI